MDMKDLILNSEFYTPNPFVFMVIDILENIHITLSMKYEPQRNAKRCP